MAIETGNALTAKKVTGRLLFKKTGEVDYINLGNVTMHKLEANTEYTPVKRARKGYIETIDENMAEVENRFTVNVDEQLEDTIKLELFATKAAANQSSATDETEQFVGVKPGRVIKLAKVNVSNVVVEVTTVAKTLGTDYTVDLGAGEIVILRGGTIADGATVDVTYDCAAQSLDRYTSMQEVKVEGVAILDEFDVKSEVPRGRYSFPAIIRMEDRGDSDGKKISEYGLNLLVTGAVTFDKRVD